MKTLLLMISILTIVACGKGGGNSSHNTAPNLEPKKEEPVLAPAFVKEIDVKSPEFLRKVGLKFISTDLELGMYCEKYKGVDKEAQLDALGKFLEAINPIHNTNDLKWYFGYINGANILNNEYMFSENELEQVIKAAKRNLYWGDCNGVLVGKLNAKKELWFNTYKPVANYRTTYCVKDLDRDSEYPYFQVALDNIDNRANIYYAGGYSSEQSCMQDLPEIEIYMPRLKHDDLKPDTFNTTFGCYKVTNSNTYFLIKELKLMPGFTQFNQPSEMILISSFKSLESCRESAMQNREREI